MTSWQPADVVAQEGGAEVQDEMTRLQIDQHARVLEAWHLQRDRLDPAWAGAASLSDYACGCGPSRRAHSPTS